MQMKFSIEVNLRSLTWKSNTDMESWMWTLMRNPVYPLIFFVSAFREQLFPLKIKQYKLRYIYWIFWSFLCEYTDVPFQLISWKVLRRCNRELNLSACVLRLFSVCTAFIQCVYCVYSACYCVYRNKDSSES